MNKLYEWSFVLPTMTQIFIAKDLIIYNPLTLLNKDIKSCKGFGSFHRIMVDTYIEPSVTLNVSVQNKTSPIYNKTLAIQKNYKK